MLKWMQVLYLARPSTQLEVAWMRPAQCTKFRSTPTLRSSPQSTSSTTKCSLRPSLLPWQVQSAMQSFKEPWVVDQKPNSLFQLREQFCSPQTPRHERGTIWTASSKTQKTAWCYLWPPLTPLTTECSTRKCPLPLSIQPQSERSTERVTYSHWA